MKVNGGVFCPVNQASDQRRKETDGSFLSKRAGISSQAVSSLSLHITKGQVHSSVHSLLLFFLVSALHFHREILQFFSLHYLSIVLSAICPVQQITKQVDVLSVL